MEICISADNKYRNNPNNLIYLKKYEIFTAYLNWWDLQKWQPFSMWFFVQDHAETKAQLEKVKKDLAETKKESHKRKKLLMAQQQLIHAGSGSYNKVKGEQLWN